jgi:type I restriction enzyme R subunit
MKTSSNFDFLNTEFADFGSAAMCAERAMYRDPAAACFHSRKTLEHVLQWLYKYERSLNAPYEHSLGALLHEPSLQNHLPETIFQKARLIQRTGNEAVHGKRPIQQYTSQQIVQDLFHVLF